MRLTPSSGSARVLAVALLFAQQSAALDGGSDRLNAYLAANPIATTSAIPTTVSNNTLSPELVSLALNHCPISCDEAGTNPGNWTLYPRLGRLHLCNQTMQLDFSLFTSLRSSETIRACTSSNSTTAGTTNGTDASCTITGNLNQVQEPVQLAFNESSTPATLSDFEAASKKLSAALAQQDSNCTEVTSFTFSNSVTVGFFAGAGARSALASVLEQFISTIKTSGFSKSAVVQLCAKDGRSSKYSFGIAASGDRDVSLVQDAVATWASGGCVTEYTHTEAWQEITLSVPSLLSNGTTTNGTTSTNSTGIHTLKTRHSLHRRATCSTVQVVSGDSCASLAAECGISGADFTTYNPNPSLCSALAVGQHVCCSSGDLPDFRPQPNPDGTCASHYVQPGESCSALGAANSLTNAEIESFNTQTWAWQGCSNVEAFQYICLSTGSPPMPASVANAVCGPQKPGTSQPGAGISLSSLNPCPLNACCNKYGQCGVTRDFCTISQSSTGAPGTSAPGQNGCISNCGTEIVVGSAPSEQISIGYFEAYNLDRPCLNMRITTMDLTPYTHIHLAFGVVTTAFAIDVSSIQEQWDLFLGLSTVKKILSLGGWSFSTEPATYSIFRSAVAPANQDTFVANIVAFVSAHDLDGIDIDWEYPAAPDIPGILAGTAADAANYLTFLQKLRTAMPSGKTISFCAPASFWYLKGYPIDEMADYADYIVYMTYDLHGQWDYANQYAIDGCPAGNCLRSQSNLTETLLALAMITKAGVPSNKITVGVTSYGRSFQMTTPGCTGPMCTYTGGASGAYPGPCTGTAGYIANAEIFAILDGTGSWKDPDGSLHPITSSSSFFDEESQSNIAVYDSTQWVAYMDDTSKADRRSLYQSLNFAGIIDWAIDLQGFAGDTIGPGAASNIVYPPPSIWTSPNPQAACKPPCIVVFPPYPLSSTTTVEWPALTTTLLSSGAGGVFVVTTTIPVPPFAISDVNVHPLTLQATDTAANYKINPMQSITPSAFVYTLPPNFATFPPTTATPTTSTTGSNTPLIIIPPVTFQTIPIPVTFQPQPTHSVDYPPPPIPMPPVTVKPTPTPIGPCTGPGCGERDCGIFGCKPGCGSFACDGGCGIFGCGGGCGVLGCFGDCPLANCGGLGCLIPGGCANTQGDGDPNNDCDEPVTASACTYLVTSFSAWYLASSTTTTETSCITSTACIGQDTKTTTTPGSPECTMDPEYAAAEAGANADLVTLVGGMQYPFQFYPQGTDVDLPYDQIGLTETITVVVTSTSTVHPTVTSTVIVPAVAKADCYHYIQVFTYYRFTVYNIENWITDGGARLKKEMSGCGAMLEWYYSDNTSQTSKPIVEFSLPFLIKSGCVERAIVSAGGPKITCPFEGYSQPSNFPSKRSLLTIDPPSPNQRQEINSPSKPSLKVDAQIKKRQEVSSSMSIPASATPYTPEVWGPGNTETFTTTVESLSKSIYTTTIDMGTFTGTPFSTSTFPSSTTFSSSSPASPSSTISTDGTCGPDNNGMTCTGSTFGTCCSIYGNCGSTPDYCALNNCNPLYGTCDPEPTGPQISTDGLCGANGRTCEGSQFGDCCSQYGYCGSEGAFCGIGCQSGFGDCNAVSTNGLCSSNSDPIGAVCVGSGFGDCCSEFGYCGSSNAYCGTGCQGAFGTCS